MRPNRLNQTEKRRALGIAFLFVSVLSGLLLYFLVSRVDIEPSSLGERERLLRTEMAPFLAMLCTLPVGVSLLVPRTEGSGAVRAAVVFFSAGLVPLYVWFLISRFQSATAIHERLLESRLPRAQLALMAQVIQNFRTTCGRLPSGDSGFIELFKAPKDLQGRWQGPYLDTPPPVLDYWGKPYFYRPVGSGGAFELRSWGESRIPNGPTAFGGTFEPR